MRIAARVFSAILFVMIFAMTSIVNTAFAQPSRHTQSSSQQSQSSRQTTQSSRQMQSSSRQTTQSSRQMQSSSRQTAQSSSSQQSQTLRPTQTLASNNVIALAGSGDTLWLATERGFNYRVSKNNDGVWNGFESGDLARRLWGLAFGGGGAAALVNHANDNTIGFWHYDHARNRQQENYFRFGRYVNTNDDDNFAPHPAGNVIFSHGKFWTPYNTGGIVRYDPTDNSVAAIRVDGDEMRPQDLPFDNVFDIADTRVLSVGTIKNSHNDNVILVTTPAALWTYDPVNKQWEVLHDEPVFPQIGEGGGGGYIQRGVYC